MKVFSLLVVVSLVQCAPVRNVHSYNAPGFSLSNYKTFDFYTINLAGEPVHNFETRIEWIKQEVVHQLKSKGLSQSGDHPDLYVNIGVMIEEKIQTRQNEVRPDAMRYIGERSYSASTEEVGRFKEGTITIHLVDRSANSLMWEGTASSVLVLQDEASHKNIIAGAQRMFSKLK